MVTNLRRYRIHKQSPYVKMEEVTLSEASTRLEMELSTQCEELKIVAYTQDGEQSSVMLLTIMDWWVAMDKCATKLYSRLLKYSPCFIPKMFDIL